MPRLDIAAATEVFVRGHAAERSRTFPYLVHRVGALWLMRDAPRRNPRDRRTEEWVASGGAPNAIDNLVRQQASGRFGLVFIVPEGTGDGPPRAAFRSLGWQLLRTEGFFVHDLALIPRVPPPVRIARVATPALAALLAAASRRRPLTGSDLDARAPRRQYVALDGDRVVGRVRSIAVADATWCADMYVDPEHRRRGIGSALLARMLRDDRAAGSAASVLTATHAGALLYERMGYRRIGTLLVFAPA